MKHRPEAPALETPNRVTQAEQTARRLAFPPELQLDGPFPSSHAHKRMFSAANTPPPTNSADATPPPGLPRPRSSDTPIQQRSRSPSYPPYQIPPLPRLEQPAVPAAQRSPSQSSGLNRPRQALIGIETFTQVKDLVSLREKDITKRINLKNNVKNIVYQREYAEDAKDEFMKACASLMGLLSSALTDGEFGQRVQQAWNQVQDTAGHVRSEEKGLETSMKDWFELENKLAIKEEKVYHKLKDYFGGGAEDADEDEECFQTDLMGYLPPPSASSSSTTRSIAHQYYNQIGDINLLKEQAFNYDSEHRRQGYIREAQRRAGQVLELSDEEFYQQFLDTKANMFQKFLSMKEKMERLRESCELQGVDVRDPNLPAFLDHTFIIDRSLYDHSGPYHGGRARHDVSFHDIQADITRRTEQWASITRANRREDFLDLETWDALSEYTGQPTPSRRERQVEEAQPSDLVSSTSLADGSIVDGDWMSSTFVADHAIINDASKLRNGKRIEMFLGEAPQRRNSTPTLPTYKTQPPLRVGTLQSTPHKPMAASFRSYVQRKKPSVSQ
jgi:hypothetical protein